jgi:hypothetical protein
VLNAPEASRREYIVAKFQILASSENIFLIYKDGWHPAKRLQEPAERVAVDEEDATLSFKNPKKDSTSTVSTTRGRTCSRRRSRCS